ncbi:hypothetical protein ACPB9J_33390 [Streptomyces lavendulocolor]|uniref:hypothetical protein n=1 Tax=Streptomyces lavendulocolor TaxID=67316 RepID=UPI003C30D550
MTTTPPPPPAAPSVPAVDQALTERCEDHGQFLAGLIAAGTLDSVGQPDRLPTQLWPDLPDDAVEAIFGVGLAVGYRARGFVEHPRFTREALQRFHAALADAGYTGMARLAARSANTLPPGPTPDPGEHPADSELDTARDGGRP